MTYHCIIIELTVGDGQIEDFEFLGYFVIYTLSTINSMAIPSSSLADQFRLWKDVFEATFKARISEVEVHLS